MLARSAENNPSVFRPGGPVDNVSVVIPQLLNIAQYTGNTWGNAKFLLMQYRPSPPPISTLSKQERKDVSEGISRAKGLEELAEKMGIELGKGKAFMEELDAKLRARPEWALWEASGRAGEATSSTETASVSAEPLPEAEAEEEPALLAATG